jgi:hypothetical protein
MTLEEMVAAGRYLEAGQIMFEAASSKSNWASAVLEGCISVTRLDHDVFRSVLDADGFRDKFSRIRKLTRELEGVQGPSAEQEVLRCMCYVAENVAKVRANALEDDDFDDDSGHWLLKNVVDVLMRLGSKNATSEAIAILSKAT